MLKPWLPGLPLAAAIEKGGYVSIRPSSARPFSPHERERRSVLAGIVALLYENRQERRQRDIRASEKDNEKQRLGDEKHPSLEHA
jgi:hypothetical protein